MAENHQNGLTGDWPMGGSYEFRKGYLNGDYSGAERLADDLRSRFENDVAPRAILLTAIQERKWEIYRKRFATDSSTVRALLVPMLTGGLHLLVNDQYSYGDHDEAVETALLAHELCHVVIFYNTSTIPARRRVRHTFQEEEFCDAFAENMTGVVLNRAFKEFSVRRAK